MITRVKFFRCCCLRVRAVLNFGHRLPELRDALPIQPTPLLPASR